MVSIRDLFKTSPIQQTDNVSSVRSENAPRSGGADLSSLRAGQTFQAQVVSRDGNDITLKLPNQQTVNAHVDEGVGIEVGKNITFEVRGSGAGVTLSPLYTNTSTDPNVLKALTMAGLPVNESSVEMTSLMMKNGLSVDRSSLQQMMSGINMNPGANIADAVDLKRLGVPVNQENLEQISAYKNLSYTIESGMKDVSERIDNAILDLVSKGDPEGAAKVFNGLSEAVTSFEIPESISGSELRAGELTSEKAGENAASAKQAGDASLSAEEGKADGSGEVSGKVISENISSKTILDPNMTEIRSAAVASENKESAGGTDIVKNDDAASKALRLLGQMTETEKPEAGIESKNASVSADSDNNGSQLYISRDPSDIRQSLADELVRMTGSESYRELDLKDLLTGTQDLVNKALTGGDTETLKNLLSNDAVRGALKDVLNLQSSIPAEDVADKEKVKDLYDRLVSQLKTVGGALESAGMQNSQAMQSVNNMSANIDFLNQINQMYAYIQLPIRFPGGDNRHGDLYVYTNGKKLSSNEGTVSALLHLDMDHLGPVDVYVAMDTGSIEPKVSTQFYVQDDEILDFLNDHMDILTARLEKRGYSISAKMSVRGESEDKEQKDALEAGGVNVLLIGADRFKGTDRGFDIRT